MKLSIIKISLVVVAAALLPAAFGTLGGCGNVGSKITSPPGKFFLSAPIDSTTVTGVTPTLSWTNSTGESRYYVEIDDDPTFATPYTASVAADATSYTVLASTLTASTKYYWRVRAVNNAGPVTAENAPFSFTTTQPPLTPSDFLLSSPTNSATGVGMTPTLTWTDAADETSYQVEIDDDPTFATPYTVSVAANTTSLTVPAAATPTVGAKYYWQVRAIGSGSGGSTMAKNAPFSFTP